MSEILKDRAVVLKTYDFGESSVIAVTLTREHGKLRLLAKGAKRGKSPLFGSLRTGSIGDVVFYNRPGRDLQLVKEMSGESVLDFIEVNLERLCMLQAGLEVADRSIVGHEVDESAFDLLEEFIKALGSARDPWALFFTLEVRLLGSLGHYPSTSACGDCGKTLDGAPVMINPADGAVACRECAGAGMLTVSPESGALLDRMVRRGFEDVVSMKLGDSERREIGELLHSLYVNHVDGYRLPKSLRLIKRETER